VFIYVLYKVLIIFSGQQKHSQIKISNSESEFDPFLVSWALYTLSLYSKAARTETLQLFHDCLSETFQRSYVGVSRLNGDQIKELLFKTVSKNPLFIFDQILKLPVLKLLDRRADIANERIKTRLSAGNRSLFTGSADRGR